MPSFTKKFLSAFLFDSKSLPLSTVTRLFQTVPLQEVKLMEIRENYAAINIDDYTLEEQLILYPTIIVHTTPLCSNTIIDIE